VSRRQTLGYLTENGTDYNDIPIHGPGRYSLGQAFVSPIFDQQAIDFFEVQIAPFLEPAKLSSLARRVF
jgi:hypothetical protein